MYGSLNRVLCTTRHGEIARFLTILAVTKRSKNHIGATMTDHDKLHHFNLI